MDPHPIKRYSTGDMYFVMLINRTVASLIRTISELKSGIKPRIAPITRRMNNPMKKPIMSAIDPAVLDVRVDRKIPKLIIQESRNIDKTAIFSRLRDKLKCMNILVMNIKRIDTIRKNMHVNNFPANFPSINENSSTGP